MTYFADEVKFNDEEYEEMKINDNGRDIEQVEDIYPNFDIKIDKGFYTVYELKRRYDAEPKRIKLDSDFQRESIWKYKQKAELIESILMGLPLPIFYFNQDKYGNLIVVDGRQRLTALFEYMDGNFSLNHLKILNQFNEMKFDDLSPVYQTRIEDFQIQAHVIIPPTPDRIKFDIFDRVNRGGTSLNKQEIRNALYQGKATTFLKTVINTDAFKLATGNAFLREKRMKDKYLITRFISFYLYFLNYYKEENGEQYVYKNDIDELLGKGMESLNLMPDDSIKQLENMTVNALMKSASILGKDAFRLINDGKRGPINMNVFEAIMFIMVEFNSVRDINIDSGKVKEEINKWINSDDFRENIGNRRDSVIKLRWRISEAHKLGRKLIG